MESTEALVDRLIDIVESVESLADEPKWYYDKVHECDLKTQDLLHLLENRTFKSYEYVRVATHMKKVRAERRTAKENQELTKLFMNNLLQLQSQGSRKMLEEKIYKTYKDMNQPYRNRFYTEEEIEQIIAGTYDTIEDLSDRVKELEDIAGGIYE